MPVTTPPTITALPAAPDPADRSTFNSRAYPWSAALSTWTTQVEAVADNVADNATDAAASATAASVSATTASGHATNAGTSATLAQNWATQTGTPVSGGEYSAKYYALQAAGVVATIPTGTINDATTSGTGVWSSSKVSTELGGKQATLVSGTNIKTINGASVLGSGDVTVSGLDVSTLVNASIPLTTNATSSLNLWHVDLDATRTMLVVSTNASIHAVVHDSTGNTFGSAVLVRSGSLVYDRVAPAILVATDRVMVVSVDATTGMQAVVLSVSGSSITVNTAATATLAGNASGQYVDLQQVGTSYVFGYVRASGDNCLRAITVSGTTPTIGAELTLGVTGAVPAFTVVDSTRLLAVSSSSTTMRWTPVSVSGSTLTKGTEATSAVTQDTYRVDILPFATGGRYWSVYRQTSSTLSCAVVSLSGTTATVSTAAFGSGNSSGKGAHLVVGNQVLYLGGGSSAYHKANVITDNAGTAVAGTQINVDLSGVSFIGSNFMWASNPANGSYLYKLGISGNNPVVLDVDVGTQMLQSANAGFGEYYQETQPNRYKNLPFNYLKGPSGALSFGFYASGGASVFDVICAEDGSVTRITSRSYIAHLGVSRVNESTIWGVASSGNYTNMIGVVKLAME